MNSIQAVSFTRSLIQIIGTAAVILGWVKPEEVNLIGDQAAVAIGAIAVIVTTAYGLYAQRKAALVQRAASLPEVAQIVTTSPKIADQAGPKVTTDPNAM